MENIWFHFSFFLNDTCLRAFDFPPVTDFINASKLLINCKQLDINMNSFRLKSSERINGKFHLRLNTVYSKRVDCFNCTSFVMFQSFFAIFSVLVWQMNFQELMFNGWDHESNLCAMEWFDVPPKSPLFAIEMNIPFVESIHNGLMMHRPNRNSQSGFIVLFAAQCVSFGQTKNVCDYLFQLRLSHDKSKSCTHTDKHRLGLS